MNDQQSSQASAVTKLSLSNRTPMSWTPERDVIFCREILVSNLFLMKKSSTERGKVWEAIADKLSDIREPIFRVDQRSVRDHYKKLLIRFKRRMREEKQESGISPERSELDVLLEEFVEREEGAENVQAADEERKKKVEEDKTAADDMRRKAMEKLSETKKRKGDEENGTKKKRRSNGNETIVYLREKTEMEMRMRKEEMVLKKTEREEEKLKQFHQFDEQAKQQKQQNNIFKTLIEQNQQQQQQMQAMQMMMLQQQQQNQAFMALIEKLSK